MTQKPIRNNPELWEQCKQEALNKMGKFSARAMQQAVQLYKKHGGGYIGDKPARNSLVQWQNKQSAPEKEWYTHSSMKILRCNAYACIGAVGAVLISIVYVAYVFLYTQQPAPILDSVPKHVTLSGTYVCLTSTKKDTTEECVFGIRTDAGEYYAVNFGQSASGAQLFAERAHIVAEGFVVIKEALSSNHWEQYNIKGIFTITQLVESR